MASRPSARPSPTADPTPTTDPTRPAPAHVAWFRAGEPVPGDRPVFLLIHGVGLSHLSFSRLAAVLADHGTVLAPDLPGFGSTRGPGRRLTVEEMAESLLPHLDRSAEPLAGRLVVLGHSLGAEVAVEVARRRPALVRGVVLVGPVVDTVAPTAFGQGRRLMLDMMGEPPITSAMVVRDYLRCGPLTYAAGVTSMLRYSTADAIGAFAHPVLLLRGRHDPVAPARWLTDLRELAVDGRVDDVPGAVHNVVHSRPRETGARVVAFATGLAQHAAARDAAEPTEPTAPAVRTVPAAPAPRVAAVADGQAASAS
jgi:pimeloyl-ACP methyl ester carboxylesterase